MQACSLHSKASYYIYTYLVTYHKRAGLSGYKHLPTKLESECEKTTKMICKDVPNKEEVKKEVEICVKTPKEVKIKYKINLFYSYTIP